MRLRWSRLAEVDLHHRLGADEPAHVDEQAEVDAVADRERQALEHRAPAGVLARQRLDDAGEVGEQELEQGPGRELGDAAAADAVALGPLVEALGEGDARRPRRAGRADR